MSKVRMRQTSKQKKAAVWKRKNLEYKARLRKITESYMDSVERRRKYE